MASDNHNGPKLPDDLLIEIYLRLSVESLLRSKCVCQHWYNLIKDPSFEFKHLKYQKSCNNYRLLLQYFKPQTQRFTYALLDGKSELSTTYHNLDYLLVPDHMLHMDGPVNGLYCLFDSVDRIVLWNPALMDFKILPLPPSHFQPHFEDFLGYIGFGLNPSTNDYKVILIRYFSDSIESMPDPFPFVTLYSLSTNTWSLFDLGDFPLYDYTFNDSIGTSFLNGTYHWWVRSGLVLAFDMRKEDFRLITGPDVSYSDITGGNIALYEEHVAVMLWDKSFVNVWLMLEEGIWIKQFSIGPLPGLVWPLGFWRKNGLIFVFNETELNMLDFNSQMILYNINTQEMTDIGPRACFYGFHTCVYYESLISIDKNERREKRDILKMVSDFLSGGPSL